MTSCDYHQIVTYCEGFLDRYGDSHLGVGWTKKKEYADLRYRVMLDALRPHWQRPLEILDFGCGLAHLKNYMEDTGIEGLTYTGLDLSDKFLAASRAKFPETTFLQVDLMQPGAAIPEYDFIFLNGIFNSRGTNSDAEMTDYMQTLLRNVWKFTRKGFAFNLMSKYLDWERDDLFHMPFDPVAAFLDREISRHFVVRHDYGLFEYTVYVYRTPLSDDHD